MSTIKVTNIQNPSASSAALVLNTDGTCSQLGVRNAIINGNPIINQRGYVSGTATSTANQYTLDRWRVVTSGQSITWTDSGNVRTVTAPAGGVEQVIEGINLITGTYTLNWTGTATATVAGNAVAKGGNVSITGGTNTSVSFSSGTFSLVQLEPGSVATPFERRSYSIEQLLCSRYYHTNVEVGTLPNKGGGSYFDGVIASVVNVGTSESTAYRFPVPMRTVPTITIWTPNNGTVGQAWSEITQANVAFSVAATSKQLANGANPTGSGISGNRYYFHYAANAEL